MKVCSYKKIVKQKSEVKAFEYLLHKQNKGSKGKAITYNCLEMADYLLPSANICLNDQREIFAIRCRTNPLTANRGIKEYCKTNCGEILNNPHIFKCTILNKESTYNIENILNGSVEEKLNNLNIRRRDIEKINTFTPQDPVILNC